MKRVIAWMLVLVLCLGLFAGCKKNKDTDPTTGDTTVSTAGLEAALEYIKTVYRKPSEKTPKDYQRIGVVPVNGVDYEVVWSADVGEEYIKIVKGADGMVTIDVNENVEAEVKYVLTATISDAAGNSVSHAWNHLIPTAGNMLSIVEDAYKLEPGEAFDYEVTLTGKITAINTPWDAGYKNITVTIVVEGAEDKPIMCYRLAGEGADKLKPNDIITVTGTIKNYNGTIEFDAGCSLDAVIEGEEIKAPEDPKQIIKEAYELAEGGALPYKATLTGKITKINTEYNPGYKNVTVTIVVDGDKDHPIQCYRLAGDGADKIGEGDTITVTGWIVNYKGTVQFGQGCTLDSWKDTGANVPKPEDTFTTTLVPEIVTEPKAGVAYKFFMYQKNYEKNFYLSGEMDGFYYATTYDPAKAADVFVEEVSGGYRLYIMKSGVKNYIEVLRQYSSSTSKYHNNVVFSTSPTAVWKWNSAIKSFTIAIDVDGTITNFYLGTYSFYKTFSASDVARITGEDAGKMDTENFVARLATMKETKVSAQEKAFEQLKNDYPIAEGVPATIENYTRKNVYDIDGEKVTVVWTEDSEAVTIQDNGDGTVTVQVTRGEEDAPYKLTATITDGDKTYTTSWDYVVSALPKTDPKDIVNAAYELKDGESMADAVTLSGIVNAITYAYNEANGNMSLELVVEGMFDKPILCYKLVGEGLQNVDIGDNITVTGIIKNYKGTIEFDTGCTLDARKGVAEIVEEAYALAEGASLDKEYTLFGVVTEITYAYKEGATNISLIMAPAGDAEHPILCYKLEGEGIDAVAVGDIAVVTGIIKNYKGTVEFDAGCVLDAYATPDTELPTLSIPEANELGAAQTDGYTDPYQVTGTVVEVKDEKFGNIYIADAAGNRLYLYGLYAEGVRYDAMTVKPVVGDVITVSGGLGQYKGNPQMKNAELLEHNRVLSIPAANELGAAQTEGYTDPYQVTGTVVEVKDEKFGNIYIADAAGNRLYLYGLYAEGVRYDAMTVKPVVGDVITVSGGLGQYKNNPQMKNAELVDHKVVVSLPEATTIGKAVADSATTDIKYQVTGTVVEIKDQKFGNMYIQDAEGNQLYIYGLYDAIGNLRYDAMTVKPAVGDTVVVYGVLCQYKGNAQVKNAWLLEHTVAESGEPEGGESTEAAYTRVTNLANVTNGNYVIAVLNGENYEVLGTTVDNKKIRDTASATVTDNVISETSAVWTITVEGSNVVLYNGTKYLKHSDGDNTDLGTSDAAYNWTIADNGDGTFTLVPNVATDRVLAYSGGTYDYYGAYKPAAKYISALLLFKAGE